MRSILSRIERLEQTLTDVAPVNPHFVKRPWTKEEKAEAFRIFIELSNPSASKEAIDEFLKTVDPPVWDSDEPED